jgi:hypothetical protein
LLITFAVVARSIASRWLGPTRSATLSTRLPLATGWTTSGVLTRVA